MNIFAIYAQYTGDFLGFTTDINVDKTLSREFVDVVICDGMEDYCDVLHRLASTYSGLSRELKKFGWKYDKSNNMSDDGFEFYCYTRVLTK